MFGEEQNGSETAKKRWSIRNALRYLSNTEFEGDITEEMLRDVFIKERGSITAAESVACRRYMQSLDDWRALDGMIDSVEGKLVETKKVDVTHTLADLVTKSYGGADGSSGGSSQPD